MFLEVLKTLLTGFVFISSMYVGSRCWKYFCLSSKSTKDTFKYFGWTLLYILALMILQHV